jgi:hypothetical protein
MDKNDWRMGEQFDPVARTMLHPIPFVHYCAGKQNKWVRTSPTNGVRFTSCRESGDMCLLFIDPNAVDESNDGLGAVIVVSEMHKVT